MISLPEFVLWIRVMMDSSVYLRVMIAMFHVFFPNKHNWYVCYCGGKDRISLLLWRMWSLMSLKAITFKDMNCIQLTYNRYFYKITSFLKICIFCNQIMTWHEGNFNALLTVLLFIVVYAITSHNNLWRTLI